MQNLSTFGAIVGMAGVLGAALAVLIGSFRRGRREDKLQGNELLFQELQAYKLRLETVEAHHKNCEKALDALRIEVEMLRNVASLTTISPALDAKFREISQKMDLMLAATPGRSQS